jgi:hypothetical protein
VSAIDKVIDLIERATVHANNMRAGLLLDLLSGQHEIPKAYDLMLGVA